MRRGDSVSVAFFCFLIAAILLFCGIAFAAGTTKTLKFYWEYDANELAKVSGWGLYMRPTSGGPHEQAIGVPKSPNLTTSQTFTVDGVPGQTVRKFFVLDAVDIDGSRSGFSNEVFQDFKIPISAPFNLTVEVVVVPTLK